MNISGISLRTIKHNDKNSILSLWTAELGRISVSIPATKSRQASRIRALTLPLSALNAEIDVRPGKNIYRLQEIRPMFICGAINSSPAKTMTAMLMADFLDLSLREQQPDSLLTRFIFESVQLLNYMPDAAALNFHIYFLIKFSRFLGIEPDPADNGSLFDMKEACFKPSEPLHGQFLDVTSTALLRKLLRMNPRNMHCFRLSRAERRSILNRILEYYSIHHRPVMSLPSLTVGSSI